MEDVVFTLNNIVDDIARMYADSADHEDTQSVDSLMDVDTIQKLARNECEGKINLSTRSDPSHSPEPPLSAKSDGGSDSEDDISLYSASLGPSPTSSGFTTPSLSPMSFTFVTNKDLVHPDVAPIRFNEGPPSMAHNNIPPGTPAPPERSPLTGYELAVLGTDPSNLAPALTLDIPRIGLELNLDSKPPLWTPSLSVHSSLSSNSGSSLLSGQDGLDIIYQTSGRPNVSLTAPRDHMPGVSPPHLAKAPPLPPRPPHPRDPPPHLPALRSPTIQSAPRLDQNQDWTTDPRTGRDELGAEHLARQREWARLTIIHASSLAEPRDLPPCRPVDKYLAWGSYSPCSISPPRKRILGAMGRRVHVGPRMLPCGDWDPERRGGAIDRWNSREALRKERMRAPEAEKEPKSRSKPAVPLRINTSGGFNGSSGIGYHTREEVEGEGDEPDPLLSEVGSSQREKKKEGKQG
ncbi:unnamed protein product [Rhizoctonia solani]|uniref:Uncharacterized protein n=1 Tax=Rhizoctonia solani TaxID=456999 RepID=A0A8H2WRI0_9AGAM|nr:unnamed protein product [Rhizoctonia solani]